MTLALLYSREQYIIKQVSSSWSTFIQTYNSFISKVLDIWEAFSLLLNVHEMPMLSRNIGHCIPEKGRPLQVVWIIVKMIYSSCNFYAIYLRYSIIFEIIKIFTVTDIDECLQYGICDQQCKNLQGKYSCYCDEGYELGSDKRSCKATGLSNILVLLRILACFVGWIQHKTAETQVNKIH